MSRSLVFRRAARREFDESGEFYEARRKGLGTRFMATVNTLLEQILATPERYPLVNDEVREAGVHDFPFCVYYYVEGSEVVVLSVFHTSRDPAVWRGRV